MAATLWFNIAHYALRPWPWILVALSSLIVYPELADIGLGFRISSLLLCGTTSLIRRCLCASALRHFIRRSRWSSE
jgi:hypothetical protein